MKCTEMCLLISSSITLFPLLQEIFSASSCLHDGDLACCIFWFTYHQTGWNLWVHYFQTSGQINDLCKVALFVYHLQWTQPIVPLLSDFRVSLDCNTYLCSAEIQWTRTSACFANVRIGQWMYAVNTPCILTSFLLPVISKKLPVQLKITKT